MWCTSWPACASPIESVHRPQGRGRCGTLGFYGGVWLCGGCGAGSCYSLFPYGWKWAYSLSRDTVTATKVCHERS